MLSMMSMMTVVACTAGHIPSVVNDDSCGVHSRPYHSCVIACVMQVREEHAMGHDSGESPPADWLGSPALQPLPHYIQVDALAVLTVLLDQ